MPPTSITQAFENRTGSSSQARATSASAATAAGLNGTAFQSWVTALQNAKRRPNRVFGPWFYFAKLPNAQIAARTPAQWERLKTQKTVTPILANALAEAQPKSLREVAEVYQEVFLAIEKRMDGDRDTSPRQDFRQRQQLVLMRMDAARRQQTH